MAIQVGDIVRLVWVPEDNDSVWFPLVPHIYMRPLVVVTASPNSGMVRWMYEEDKNFFEQRTNVSLENAHWGMLEESFVLFELPALITDAVEARWKYIINE